jgi:hypothetical protein
MEYRLDLEISDKQMREILQEGKDYIALAKQAYAAQNWNGVQAAVSMANVMANLLMAERINKLCKIIDHIGEKNAQTE